MVLTRYWIALAIVFVLALVINQLAGKNVISNIVTLLPASGALLGALWLAFRDHVAHERSKELQDKQNFFTLGATSHMANVVFDKHVKFCEKYLEEVHNAVVTLTREGPTKKALDHTSKLYTLRVENTAWLPLEIEDKLMPFEKALRKIGANSGLVETLGEGLRTGAYQEEEEKKRTQMSRSKAIEEMYDIFSNMMDLGDAKIKDADATVKSVKEKVRDILQIRELVEIRTSLIRRSHNQIAEQSENSGDSVRIS